MSATLTAHLAAGAVALAGALPCWHPIKPATLDAEVSR